MADEVKSTPLPWYVIEYPGDTKIFAGDCRVADIRGWGYLTGVGGLHLTDEEAEKVQHANAQLIVRAVNSHEELLSELRKARETLRDLAESVVAYHSDDGGNGKIVGLYRKMTKKAKEALGKES